MLLEIRKKYVRLLLNNVFVKLFTLKDYDSHSQLWSFKDIFRIVLCLRNSSSIFNVSLVSRTRKQVCLANSAHLSS